MTARVKADVDDLYHLPENAKGEIVNGGLLLMSPTGDAPNYAAGEIFASLREHAKATKRGRAVTDNAAFRVSLPNRESFSPDAAFYTGPPRGMKFFEGAPAFAVEVRSEGDYGPEAEHAIAQKRHDYFAAGTLVVWDVDLLGDDVIKSYDAQHPENPTVFRRGEIANAEPAVPGWSIPVDVLFA